MRIKPSYILLNVLILAVGTFAAASEVRRSIGSVSPMDSLDREKIPAVVRRNLPPDVVAVMAGDPRSVAALAFVSDGRTLILAHLGGPNKGDLPGTIEMWNLSDAAPQEIVQLDAHRDWISSLAISPNGKMLVSGGTRFDQSIHFWSLSGNKPQHSAALTKFSHWWHHALVFSPDGKWLATVSGSEQGPVQLWDVSDVSKQVKEGPVLTGLEWGISAMAFTADGRYLIAALGSGHHHPNDGTLLVWERNDTGFALKSKIEDKGHEMSALAISPDGHRFVAGYADGAIKLFGLTAGTPQEKAALRDHGDSQQAIAFLPNGEQFLSASQSGTVDEWDALGAKSMRQWRFPGSLSSMALSSSGQYAAVGLADGRTAILKLPNSANASGDRTNGSRDAPGKQ
jgi:WD40 repeat protein